MTFSVECKNISKSFGKVKALKDVSFQIEENKIYGLLGRNGAGKSTLLKIITSHIFADKGTVKIYDEVPYENENALGKICFVRNNDLFPKDLKVKDLLYNASIFYPYYDKPFEDSLIKKFNLDINKKYKELSSGMKSALGIIIGLSSRAPITIYDEPYVGLDAAARQMFYDILIEDYSQNPRTIILSTHLIEEESRIFEDIIILDNGQILATENVETFISKGFYISGNKSKVDTFIKNKNVVHMEDLGFTKIAAIFDSIDKNDEIKLVSEGLDLSPIPLQKLFIYLTERN